MRVKLGLHSFQCSHKFELFARSHIVENMPFLVNGLISHWPATKNWSMPRILHLYGGKLFSCGNSTVNNSPIIMTLDDYFLHCQSTSNSVSDCHSPLYIFDSTFEEDCEALLTDYSMPSVFTNCLFATCVPANFRPNYRWFLVGGTGSGSMLHVDPLHTSAWNALVTGKKRWVLIEPPLSNKAIPCVDVLRAMSSLIPESFISSTNPYALFQACTDLSQQSAFLEEVGNDSIQFELPSGLRCLMFTQCAGQTVFVPHGWPHAVLNVELSVAITHNFLHPSTLLSVECAATRLKLFQTIVDSWCTEVDVPVSVVEAVWHKLSKHS